MNLYGELSDQLKIYIMRYKRTGHNADVMRQSAFLVVNPITVNNFPVLFNCTPMGQSSDSMITPQHKAKYLVGWGWTLVSLLAHRSPTSVFFCSNVSVVLLRPLDLHLSQRVVTVKSSSLLHHSLSIDFNCFP